MINSNASALPFRERLQTELGNFILRQQSAGFPSEETLKIDLHCHDLNSDVPDETLGRLLRLPETWLRTEALTATLRRHGTDVLTITNHNNARSCWSLLEKGIDVLVAAEFSCTLPDFNVGVHVLTYGFTPIQEARLNTLRKDIYKFLEYTRSEDIVTVLAHPLHFYCPDNNASNALMDRLGILFERFECVNGQRDTWQNLLTATWLEGMNPERIEAMAKRTGLSADTFCKNPYRKLAAGGSDCHMGIFAGATGTLLHVPNLSNKTEAKSVLALEALKAGRMAPYGSSHEEERLRVAFLDYFCQVALHMEDPGLLRLMLHRGEPSEKLLALGIANAMLELRRHKTTSRFLQAFHASLQGEKPGIFAHWFTSKTFRPLISDLDAIAVARQKGPDDMLITLRERLPAMFARFSKILAERVTDKIQNFEQTHTGWNSQDWIRRLEIPAQMRALFDSSSRTGRPDQTPLDIGKLSDGLSFPLLAATVMGGAAFTSAKVLYGERPFLNKFAAALGKQEHPKRLLWLTDTLRDKNGVSHALSLNLEEVRRRDLPIDFLACGANLKNEEHLLALPSISEFTLPFYKGQNFRLPDLLQLHEAFAQGGYDRIICSTEAPMGFYALYLKHAFCVPAYFYMHTDWIDFAQRTLNFDTASMDRLRRFLRTFYKMFDGIFVLNTEQKEWLASPAMGIPRENIFLTAHWAHERFVPDVTPELRPDLSSTKATLEAPVLLYAGRLSEEKGVMDLPKVLAQVRIKIPGARLVLAGTGPAEEKLKAALPDAEFLGWVDTQRLPAIYASAQILLLPSRFDTFGCVVLEAMSCGLPVIAYNTKGPRDLIEDGKSGFLVETCEEMAEHAIRLLQFPAYLQLFQGYAIKRARNYAPGPIMQRLLRDVGLDKNGETLFSADWDEAPEVKSKTKVDGDFFQTLMELMN